MLLFILKFNAIKNNRIAPSELAVDPCSCTTCTWEVTSSATSPTAHSTPSSSWRHSTSQRTSWERCERRTSPNSPNSRFVTRRLLRCLCDTRSLTCLFLFTLTTFQTTFLPQLDSADDTILYITFKPKIETVALQKDRNKLGKWAKTWNMEFNLKKCPSACILSMLRLGGMLKKKRRLIVLLTSWRLRTLPGSLSSSILCRCVTSQCGTDYFYVQAFLYARLFSLNASICRRFQTKCRFTPTKSARGAHPKTYLAAACCRARIGFCMLCRLYM